MPDRTSVYGLLDGPLGQALAGLIEERTGYVVLGYWDNGLRHVSSVAAILASEDCRGHRIRTLKNEQHQRVFRVLGFETKFIDVSGLPAALLRGEVDSQENPLTNIYNFNLQQTQKHVTLTSHLLGISLVLFNKKRYQMLPDDVRLALSQAVGTATRLQRQFAQDDDEICMEKLAGDGVVIHRLSPAERERFASAVRPEVDRIRTSYPAHLLAMFDEGVGGKPEPLVAPAVGTRSAGKQP